MRALARQGTRSPAGRCAEAAGAIALERGPWRVELAPAHGARITRLTWQQSPSDEAADLLVPWPPGVAFEPQAWCKAGAFPMLPFTNRLPGGAFVWQGRRVTPRPMAGSADALHGVGHRQPWQVLQRSAGSLSMAYAHEAGTDGWPWPFLATMAVDLTDAAVTVRLALCNQADEAVPVALGWHPYHRVEPRARVPLSLRASARRAIPPTGPIPLPPDWPAAVDAPESCPGHVFDAAALAPQTTHVQDWDGRLALALDATRQVVVEAPGSRQLLMHVPAAGAEAFICLEPLTAPPGTLAHTDCSRLAAGLALAPGACRALGWTCRVDARSG